MTNSAIPQANSQQEQSVPLRLSAADLAKKFNRQAFTFAHTLQEHPLFSLSSLVALSKRLPPERVEYNVGKVKIAESPESVQGNGLTIAETIEQIQRCESWLVLKHVQSDPAYAALLDTCLDQVESLLPPNCQPIFSRVGFIFVSSPHAVTPFHIDPENNFLLQIAGSKTLRVFAAEDRDLVSEQALETFYGGGHRNLQLPEDLIQRSNACTLCPGQALHVPQHAPHYVQNGDSVSISFSITFQTALSDQVQGIYWCNNRLRRLGMSPSPPGRSEWKDASKYSLYAGLRQIKRWLNRQRSQQAG